MEIPISHRTSVLARIFNLQFPSADYDDDPLPSYDTYTPSSPQITHLPFTHDDPVVMLAFDRRFASESSRSGVYDEDTALAHAMNASLVAESNQSGNYNRRFQ